jgi:hypothetical protein
LALYCVDGLVFCPAIDGAMQAISGGALSRAVLTRRSGDHPDATALTAQPDLFELPKHPDKGGAKTDDDGQKQQSKSGSCEHGEHPSKEANGVDSERAEMIATEAHYTKVAASSRAPRLLF